MGALKSSRDEVRQSKLFHFSVSIWTSMTHFSQRSWSFFLRSARTFMFIRVEDTALLSPDRRLIRVRSRIHCRFGSASVALQNHSFAPAHSAFPDGRHYRRRTQTISAPERSFAVAPTIP